MRAAAKTGGVLLVLAAAGCTTTGQPPADDAGIAAQWQVHCASHDNRRHYCDADTGGGVQLLRQASGAGCVQGSTWGYDARGIWVEAGCAGVFGGPLSAAQPHQTHPDGGLVVRCESPRGQRQRCNAVVPHEVLLMHQLSETRCVQRQNWGWDRGGVWVSGGCGAEFHVR